MFRLPNKPCNQVDEDFVLKARKEMVDRVSDDNIHFGTVQGIRIWFFFNQKDCPLKSAIYKNSELVRLKGVRLTCKIEQSNKSRTKSLLSRVLT